MKNFWLLLSVLWLWTCSGGGDKATGPQDPPLVINLTSLDGQAQKGPFNNGTAINIAELTNTLSPTGRNFSSAITDNTGRFAVANVQLESPYVELRANGYYFNEVSNEISSGQLTLFALSNLTGKTSLNVNILTHLEKNRMVTLMSGDNPKTFAQAKLQAQEEVLAIFDYSRENVPEFELLDISQSGAANAKLLAISAIIQGNLNTGQMSELLANISTDITNDGTLDDTNLRNTLIENTKNLDMAEVRSNLEARYVSLGITATIPDFESEINQFLKPPVVQDINLSVEEDNTIDITLTGSDPEGESITFSIVNDTDNATLTLNGNVVNYNPNTHFNGTDTFTYKANDGTSDSNTGTVTITVNAVDDEPNTVDVAATTDEDNAVEVSLSAEEYDGDSYSFAIISDVTNGTTSLNGSTVTYTPNQDFNGEDIFTFEATDDTGRTMNVATATITVNAVNDAPVATDVITNGNEDEVVTYDLSSNVSDVDGDDLTYSLGNVQPMWGSVTLDGSILTYTPNANYFGTDNLSWKVSDGGDDNVTRQFSITIESVNDAPVANDLNVSTNELRFSSLDITLDASDVELLPLTYTIESNTSNGTTSLNGNIVTYVPTTDWNGEDSFTYKANDGELDSNIASVTITVNPVNDAPVVQNQSASTNEDTVVDITLLGSDIENDTLTYSIVESNNGTISISGTTATYTPNQDWNGNDTFTYKANDGTDDSNTATVTVTVAAVNDAPVTQNVSVTTDEDSPYTESYTAYVSDVDGDALTITAVTSPTNGTATCDASSTDCTYTPNQNFNGTDSFTYKVNDGELDSNISTVSITVNAQNDAPTVSTGTISTNEDTAATLDLSTLATDVDGDDLTFNNTPPANGSVTIDGSILTYTPKANWNGTESFMFTASDGTVTSGQTQIVVTVATVNDAPIANAVSASTNEDTAKAITLVGSDVDTDDTLTYSIADQPSNGTASISGTTLTYTPDSNFNGTDTIFYQANDGQASSNSAIVTITVAAVNDAPTVTAGTISTNEDNAATIDLSTLTNDVDGDTLEYDIPTGPSNGTVSISGTIATYTPNSNWNGTDSFTYEAYDGIADPVVETITVTVIAGSFETTYGSDSNHETAGSITYTSDGGAVVIGYRYYTDWLVVKFDSAGNAEWEYTISSSEGPSQVIETIDEGIVIAGNSGNGKTIIKLDSSGNEVFSSSNLPGSGIYVLKEDSSGNIYTSGYESVNGTNSGSLTKLDSNGNLLWNKTYRKYSSNAEYVEAFVIHSDQSITAFGFGQNASNNEWMFNVDSSGNASNIGYIDLDGGYPKNAELLSNGNIQLIVDNDQIVEVSTDFRIISTINLSSPDAGGSIGNLKPTSDGGFIGAGKLNDSSTSSVDDGFFIKYDSSGTAEITKNVATSLRDWFNSVDVIPSGGYYFAGWSKGDDGDWDFYLVKVDDQGNRIF